MRRVAKLTKSTKRTHGPLKFLDPETSVVFLALAWFGPRALSIVDILDTFDYLNHATLGLDELEHHLNALLAAGLLDVRPGNMFALAPGVHERYQQFRTRRRKTRFADAEAFIRLHDWADPLPRRIRLSKADLAESKPVVLPWSHKAAKQDV